MAREERRFFYGWIIVACAACASFARQGVAVATLSIFVAPMTAEFGWSHTAMSGAVALGGLGALIAPALGPFVDRAGGRLVLLVSIGIVAACAYGLSGIEGLVGFYVFFGLARMAFAGPFDVAVSTAIINWFERFRARAMSYATTTAALSLAIMPVLAQAAIDAYGWRGAWIAIAIAALVVGGVPVALFMRRRPEDLGLQPDGGLVASRNQVPPARGIATLDFTRAEALRTRSFWLLTIYTALAFAIQAGISLHQAPYLIERGVTPTTAATIVGTFSISAAAGSLLFGRLGDRFPIRALLVGAALLQLLAALNMTFINSALDGYIAALIFGVGLGGLMTLTPLAFAAYFGRRHYGAIRGLAVPAQVIGQAVGPLIAGAARDFTGSYIAAFLIFAAIGLISAGIALAAFPPLKRRATEGRR